MWPSESHGGFVGGGEGVPLFPPPPEPNASPGRTNKAVTAIAMAIGKIFFFIVSPPPLGDFAPATRELRHGERNDEADEAQENAGQG